MAVKSCHGTYESCLGQGQVDFFRLDRAGLKPQKLHVAKTGYLGLADNRFHHLESGGTAVKAGPTTMPGLSRFK